MTGGFTGLGIELAGENGHGDPIWGKKEMSAHRWVSRRVRGWRLESGSRRSCGWNLEFGELGCSEERTRARRSELATVSSLRKLFWREEARKSEVDASTLRGASPWTSCARWELMSGAIAGVRRHLADRWRSGHPRR